MRLLEEHFEAKRTHVGLYVSNNNLKSQGTIESNMSGLTPDHVPYGCVGPCPSYEEAMPT